MKLDKEKLINLINRAKQVEEDAVPNLATHVIAAMDFLEKDNTLREKIIAVMNTLKTESSEHAAILDGIVEDINNKITELK